MPVAMQLLEMLATKPVNSSARPGWPGRSHDSSGNTTFRLSERRLSLLLDTGVAAVDEEHQEDDQTVEDLLPGELDADDLKHVLEQNHGDRPGDGPGVAAGAAEDRGATDDHCGDGRQHVQVAHPEVALLRVTGEHDPAQTSTEPAKGVRQHQHPAHRDAGEIARLRVVTNGVEPFAIDCAAQHEDQHRAEEGPK